MPAHRDHAELTIGACIALENRFACLVISSCSSRGNAANLSYLVPIRTGIAVCHQQVSVGPLALLKPLACRYHSFTLLRVAFRVRSNMNRMATASLDTRGNIDTNSLCPPRSQILRISEGDHCTYRKGYFCIPDCNRLFHKIYTQRLDVILTTISRGAPFPTYSKLPSTYLTIRDVFPICESPTMPTLRTILASARL